MAELTCTHTANSAKPLEQNDIPVGVSALAVCLTTLGLQLSLDASGPSRHRKGHGTTKASSLSTQSCAVDPSIRLRCPFVRLVRL